MYAWLHLSLVEDGRMIYSLFRFQLKVNDCNPHKFVKPNIARSQLAQVQYQSLYSYNSAHTLNIFSTYSSIYSYNSKHTLKILPIYSLNSAHILNIFPIYSSIYFYNSAYTFKPTFFHTLSSSQPRWPRLKWLWGPFTLGPFYSPGTKSLLPICASLCTTQASLKGFSKQRIHCSAVDCNGEWTDQLARAAWKKSIVQSNQWWTAGKNKGFPADVSVESCFWAFAMSQCEVDQHCARYKCQHQVWMCTNLSI